MAAHWTPSAERVDAVCITAFADWLRKERGPASLNRFVAFAQARAAKASA